MIELKEIADRMSTDDIVLTYQGKLDAQILDKLLHFSEAILTERNVDKVLRKKIFIILVESLQNCYKHQMVDGLGELMDFTVALTHEDDGFHLVLGNYMTLHDRDALKEKLDDINSLDQKQLNNKYIEVLDNGEQTASGGSGLGLIELARKSGNPLQYSFTNASDEMAYFVMQINISK
ncbi:MAG: SiaB family protein kinase [Flavobacteriales bacterium]|nr:SiaB family protein kinase [Flavobacteriales bacterium]